ncbi:MAG: MtrB/PioB family outer membrane beta-barrel protein, partial [Alphaproteobacteria bacterium]|nr:MtrB/PioB family outer membrane beta-barrel protein [Alphaproteobacteria bacterium]
GADEYGYSGRYNGMKDSGAGFVGSFDLQSRDPWDSGGNHYFSFTGDNIDFGFGYMAPEANLELKTGHQGEWGIDATYDAMTYTATDHFTTILDKEGNLSAGYMSDIAYGGAFLNNSPTSSSFYGAYRTRSGITSSAGNHVGDYGPANELIEKIGTRRDKGAIEGHYEIGDWLLSAAVSHEHKSGDLEQAMTTGGSNSGMVTFPMPIDYDTDTYTVAAAYTVEKFQAKIAYEFSNFIDHNRDGFHAEGWNFTSIQDPVTHNYTSYEQNAIYGLPPSNQAHTVTGEIGYNISPSTRVFATAVYSLQLQNDPFVAATGDAYVLNNPVMSAQLATNPASLNGEVNTFFGNVTLTSNPLPKLDVRAAYSIDTRDPNTNAMWIYGDPTDATALKYREAVPESWTKQQFNLRLGYRLMPETRVTAEYAYRNNHRNHAITHDTDENSASIGIRSLLADNVTGSLGYTYSDRTASAPDYSLWNTQINSDCGAEPNLGCQQIPFYEAARTENAVKGSLAATLNNKATVSLFGKYSDDHFHNPDATRVISAVTYVDPSVGVNHMYSVQAGPDFSYRVDQTQEVHAFYTFLRTYRDMRALANPSALTGPNTNFPNATPTSLTYYNEASTYDIQTFGIGGTWQANPKLKIVADYTYSYGDQGFRQNGAWTSGEGGQAYGGDPSLKTDSTDHQLRINAIYDYSPSTSFALGYRFDSLDLTDWALVGASVGQVLTGDIPPNYNVSTIMAAMTLKM